MPSQIQAALSIPCLRPQPQYVPSPAGVRTQAGTTQHLPTQPERRGSFYTREVQDASCLANIILVWDGGVQDTERDGILEEETCILAVTQVSPAARAGRAEAESPESSRPLRALQEGRLPVASGSLPQMPLI